MKAKVRIPKKPPSFTIPDIRATTKTIRLRLPAYHKCAKIAARTGRTISEVASLAVELIE